MTTSVEAIELVLFKLRQHQDKKAMLRDALASCMGMEGKSAGYHALIHFVTLFDRLESEIEALSIEENLKNRCLANLRKFNGVRSFAQVGGALEPALKQFLTSDHIAAIAEIRVELNGLLPKEEQIGDHTTLLRTFEDALGDLLKEQLPLDMKALLSERLQQVIDCIRAYQFLGKASLQKAMEALVGATATALFDPEVAQDTNYKQAVFRVSKTALHGIAYLHLALTGTYEAVEASQGLYQLLSAASGAS